MGYKEAFYKKYFIFCNISRALLYKSVQMVKVYVSFPNSPKKRSDFLRECKM